MADVYKIKQLGLSFLFLFLLSTPSQAQLLWKISGKDSKESYIFGTHHLIPSSKAQEIKGLDEAFNKSTLILGEISIEELSKPEELNYMTQAMLAPEDSLLQTVVSEHTIEQILKLDKAYPNEQIPLNSIAQMLTPTAISLLLNSSITQHVMQKMFPKETAPIGIDFVLQQKAIEAAKPVKGLESLRFQTDLLYKSNSIAKGAKDLTEMLDCLEEHMDYAIAEIELLSQNYLKQDLKALYEQAKTSEGPCSIMQLKEEDWAKMVDLRNKNWITQIKTFIANEHCFLAVGALHLPGENGVLELLRQEGYTVEPLCTESRSEH